MSEKYYVLTVITTAPVNTAIRALNINNPELHTYWAKTLEYATPFPLQREAEIQAENRHWRTTYVLKDTVAAAVMLTQRMPDDIKPAFYER